MGAEFPNSVGTATAMRASGVVGHVVLHQSIVDEEHNDARTIDIIDRGVLNYNVASQRRRRVALASLHCLGEGALGSSPDAYRARTVMSGDAIDQNISSDFVRRVKLEINLARVEGACRR